MKQLLLLLFSALTAAAPLAAEVITPGVVRNDYPLIIPQPQKFEMTQSGLPLPAELTVAAPENFDFSPLGKVYAKAVKGGKVVRADRGAKAFCRFELTKKGVPESVEGYTLDVTPVDIVIRARDARGLFYGMQTLKWIIRNSRRAQLSGCRITDWPDLEMRGLFFELPNIPPAKVDRLCEVIGVLAELKYNMILIEFADNFPLSIGKDFARPKGTFSRADVEKIMAAAKRNHIELVPKLQVVSHVLWLTRHRDWAKFSEGRVVRPWCSLSCLSNPEVLPVIEKVVSETADLIKPRYFHLGLDEITSCGYPICPKCKAANRTELLLAHIRPIKKLLADRGITTIIYQDEFFDVVPSPTPRKGKPMADFPEKLGHDVMINSWEYDIVPSPAIGEAIRKRGFKDLIYMSYSNNLYNSWRMPQLARKLKTKGNILAYWYSMLATMDAPFHAHINAFASTIAQANYAWNVSDVDFNRLPIDSTTLMRGLVNDLPALFRGKAAAVPLAGGFNRVLGNDPQFPIFDEKLAAEVKRAAAADRAKFDVAVRDGGVAAAVLSGTPGDGYGATSVQIPIGTKATGASFLMASSLFNNFVLKNGVVKLDVGRIEIVYADGKRATVKLTLRDNLNDWNTYIGGNNCRAALRGNDAQGSLFGFYAIDWRNPRPQTAIREFVVASKPDSGAALALFAISLSNAAAAPAGDPAAAVLATVPPRRPEAALTPVADFAKGIPAGAKVLGTSIPGFRYRLIDDPKGGKMLEFIVPETKGKFARCLIDVPVKVPADFKYVTFDVEVSDPSALWRDHLGHYRADVYFLKSAGGHTKTLGALGYAPTLDEKRHTVTLPRDRFTVKEFGGLEPAEAAQLRVGFFLNSPVKPLTIRVGNVYFCDRPRAGRAVVKTPVL